MLSIDDEFLIACYVILISAYFTGSHFVSSSTYCKHYTLDVLFVVRRSVFEGAVKILPFREIELLIKELGQTIVELIRAIYNFMSSRFETASLMSTLFLLHAANSLTSLYWGISSSHNFYCYCSLFINPILKLHVMARYWSQEQFLNERVRDRERAIFV